MDKCSLLWRDLFLIVSLHKNIMPFLVFLERFLLVKVSFRSQEGHKATIHHLMLRALEEGIFLGQKKLNGAKF